MTPLHRVLFVLPALALAGCATSPITTTSIATGDPLMNQAQVGTVNPPPAQQVATAASATDISAYIDANAFAQLSNKSKNEAAAAQFNALQFGRVGAPRAWVGDNGASGQVTVGPYVRVNLIDCREFTHVVMIDTVGYTRNGTACREADGSWSVSSAQG